MPPTMFTQIYLAEVQSRIDPGLNGIFQARISILGNDIHPINYVSPYTSNGQGAFVAIPEVGSEILVCQPVGSTEFYFLGSTFAPEPDQATGTKVSAARLKPLERVDPYIYRAQGVPQKMVWSGPQGGRLIISEESNPRFFNNKIELLSSKGKNVRLNDSPGENSIVLDSGNQSKITISDDPQNNSLASQAVEVYTVGPQKYLNMQDQTDIVVQDGKELQILNQSTGSKAPGFEPNKAGNVNIQSRYKDVNVFTKADEGRIFIECLQASGSNQVIEIQTNGADGAIRIKTQGKVDIEANEIGISASGNINMKGDNINIEARNMMNLTADTVINAKADEVQLNPTYTVSGASPSIGNTESYYENSGITTYPS